MSSPLFEVIRLCLCAAFLVWLPGCGTGAAKFVWTEDVQLSDGSIIEVHREVRYASLTLEMGGPGSASLRDATVQIISSNPQESVPWKMQLKPLHVDKDPASGSWVIVGEFYAIVSKFASTCDFWVRYGRPVSPEVAFALQDGVWKQVVMPDAFIGKRVNLLRGVPQEDISKVTLEKKEQWFARMDPEWPSLRSERQLRIGRDVPLQCDRYLRATGKL